MDRVELRELLVLLKEMKVKQFKSGNYEIEFHDVSFYPEIAEIEDNDKDLVDPFMEELRTKYGVANV